MKFKPLCFLMMVLLLIFSCSSNDDSNGNDISDFLNNYVTQCNDETTTITGGKAAYWDFANAKPIGLTQVPLIKNPGQQFIHSLQPLLGFTIPQGFSAFELTNPQTQTIGVDVLRNDNAVFFRWIPTSSVIGQQISSQSFIANEINNLFSFYNFNGTPEVICSEFKQEVFATIPREFNARLIRFNGRIAQVWVITTYAASSTYITTSVVTAPEDEYSAQVANTFLPINYQLYVNDNGDIVDQDGDGWTVLEDPDDTDPDVP